MLIRLNPFITSSDHITPPLSLYRSLFMVRTGLRIDPVDGCGGWKSLNSVLLNPQEVQTTGLAARSKAGAMSLNVSALRSCEARSSSLSLIALAGPIFVLTTSSQLLVSHALRPSPVYSTFTVTTQDRLMRTERDCVVEGLFSWDGSLRIRQKQFPIV
jgi:hypothetical protein